MTANPKLRLAHFGMYARDIVRMEDFYTRVMGFTVTDRGPYPFPEAQADMVFMSSDPNEHHQFILLTGHPDHELEFTRNQQIAFTTDTLDDLRNIAQRLNEADLPAPEFVSHGNALSLYFSDPESNRIETYIHTPWHVPQPYRHQLDISESNQEIMARVEKICRADPGFMTSQEREQKMAEIMGLKPVSE